MIKTTELMLGNLVEYDGKYVQVSHIYETEIRYKGLLTTGYIKDTDINPIPLTDAVLKRLKMQAPSSFFLVHNLQNWKIVNNLKPIDITPLLSPRYTTHDGVEVWDFDDVWIPIGGIPSKVKCTSKLANFFSTQEACQSYIDKVTRKPIFTTEDGVDVFEGDVYIGVFVNGFNQFGHKGKPFYTSQAPNFKIFNYFSKYELAQAYLNKVWAEKEFNDLMGRKEYNG